MSFLIDIDSRTNLNKKYREIIFSNENIEITVMNILPKQEIGFEKHSFSSQFIKIENGLGIVEIKKDGFITRNILTKGFALVIAPNTIHNIKNISSKYNLKLYSIYSPPID